MPHSDPNTSRVRSKCTRGARYRVVGAGERAGSRPMMARPAAWCPMGENEGRWRPGSAFGATARPNNINFDPIPLILEHEPPVDVFRRRVWPAWSYAEFKGLPATQSRLNQRFFRGRRSIWSPAYLRTTIGLASLCASLAGTATNKGNTTTMATLTGTHEIPTEASAAPGEQRPAPTSRR